MEKQQRAMGTESYRARYGDRGGLPRAMGAREASAQRLGPGASLSIGAKTVAGIGIGLVAVVGGAALLGLAAETILVPSLLMKLAGGIAGGGVGMAKGLKDTKAAN